MYIYKIGFEVGMTEHQEPIIDMFTYMGVYFPESQTGKAYPSQPKYPGLDRRYFDCGTDEDMYLYVRHQNIYALVHVLQRDLARFSSDWILANSLDDFDFQWLFPQGRSLIGNRFVIDVWSLGWGMQSWAPLEPPARGVRSQGSMS